MAAQSWTRPLENLHCSIDLRARKNDEPGQAGDCDGPAAPFAFMVQLINMPVGVASISSPGRASFVSLLSASHIFNAFVGSDVTYDGRLDAEHAWTHGAFVGNPLRGEKLGLYYTRDDRRIHLVLMSTCREAHLQPCTSMGPEYGCFDKIGREESLLRMSVPVLPCDIKRSVPTRGVSALRFVQNSLPGNFIFLDCFSLALDHDLHVRSDAEWRYSAEGRIGLRSKQVSARLLRIRGFPSKKRTKRVVRCKVDAARRSDDCPLCRFFLARGT